MPVIINAGGETITVPYTISSSFVYGQTQPVASNVGLNVTGIAEKSLKVIDDTHPAFTQGGTLDGFDIHGWPALNSDNNLLIKNSILRGSTFPDNNNPPRRYLIQARSSKKGRLSFENCIWMPAQPNGLVNLVGGEKLGYFRRCHFTATGGDAIDYWGPDPDVQGCLFEGYVFVANDPTRVNDPTHPGWAHQDGVQSTISTAAMKIYGNAFHWFANPKYGDYAVLGANGYPNGAYGSPIMLTTSGGDHFGEVSYNWFWGGGDAHISHPDSNKGFVKSNVAIHHNRHALSMHRSGTRGIAAYWSSNFAAGAGAAHDNIFMDDPTVPVNLRGKLFDNQNPARFVTAAKHYSMDTTVLAAN